MNVRLICEVPHRDFQRHAVRDGKSHTDLSSVGKAWRVDSWSGQHRSDQRANERNRPIFERTEEYMS